MKDKALFGKHEGVAPLSLTQEWLWSREWVRLKFPGNNLAAAKRLVGCLNVEHLEQAIDEIQRRHQVLRSRFPTIDGEARQIITPPMPFTLAVVDFTELPPEERDSEARRKAAAEAQRPFDISRGPLLRTMLLRLDKTSHVLLLIVHRLVADDWSLDIFFNELIALYDAQLRGQPCPLDDPPLQYADFAAWQRQQLRSEKLKPQLFYWRSQLSGISSLELPKDRPRPPTENMRGAEHRFEVPELIHTKLALLAHESGCDLFTVLLAAFSVLLQRYTGQDDVVVGTLVSNRESDQRKNLIGCVANRLALRVDCSGNPRFTELLRRVRQVTQDAWTHGEVPFEGLIEELESEPDLSRHPLLQVMFQFRQGSHQSMEVQGLRFEHWAFDTGITQYDLSLEMIEVDAGFAGLLRYNADLFETATINRMLGHLRTLLQGMVADPEGRIADLPLLTTAERQQLLVDWNQTTGDYPRQATTHELFEQWAQASPDALALVFEDRRLSYRELNAQANQLTRYLSKRGVGPETLVGLCVERGVDLIVGILGTFKAGSAYVPLDPKYPERRLSFMLRDAAVPVLLTQQRLRDKVADYKGEVIYLDSDWPKIACESELNSAPAATAEDLAYVIYTSGSTGEPKGTLLEHRGLCNVSAEQIRRFRVGPGSRVLQFSSSSFDASIFEIVMALTSGATLVLAKQEDLQPGPPLAKLLRDQAITILTIPPSSLNVVPPTALSALRTVNVAGEPCSAQLVARWAPGRQFFNLYGPTECTIWATTAECRADGRRPNIGRPIANTQVYVLDGYGEPVPVGVPGEMYIGGAGVGRGYLNPPELTAERFVDDPFSAEPGVRLYRTGDLVRYRPDGNLEFVGRVDQQVKVRGFRIELGEIEAVLGRHAEVQDVVVVAREDEPGEKRLVVYIVPQRDGTVSESDLQQYIRETLPEFMVPSTFVTLDSLPLTPNGKVDRQALPAPHTTHRNLDQPYHAPRSALERALAEVWQDVLKMDQVGVFDNFFDLGGDSLLGGVLTNKIQKRLGEQLYIVALFDAPTVAEQGVYLQRHFPEAVAKQFDAETPFVDEVRPEAVERDHDGGIDEPAIEEVRHSAASWRGGSTLVKRDRPSNPSMCFILTSLRSGSSLLRIMMAGHHRLFAPPELELLTFDTLGEREEKCSGRYHFMLEGTVRALMEIHACSAEQAARIMQRYEREDYLVQDFYRVLQESIGERMLVEKSTTYAFYPDALVRAETDFENNFYIHLVRHPYGAIRSFEEARLDRVLTFGAEHNYSVRQLAELIWVVSHRNILSLLDRVPQHRQLCIRFEDLVGRPLPITQQICGLLGVAYDPEMLEPYRNEERKMTDGVTPQSVGMTDPKFHQHDHINVDVAAQWKEVYEGDFLSDVTWQLAGHLGYPRDAVKDETRPLTGVKADQRSAIEIKPALRKADQPPPLSHSQQRLWFIDQLAPGNVGYNTGRVIRLEGSLDVSALESSLNEIIGRHEVCRTNYEQRNGQVVQIVHPHVSLYVKKVDLQELSPAKQEKEVERIALDETMRPFDLAKDSLWRAALLRLSDHEHVLILNIHHILTDAWTRGVIHRELSALYAAFSKGKPSPLPELPIQYADFAIWQQRGLEGRAGKELLSYWLERLRGAPEVHELPTDRPRPTVQSYVGSSKTLTLSVNLCESLKSLAKREGASFFMALLGVFNVLVSRYSNRSDVVIGIPVAGRNRSEVEDLIGLFLNILPIRSEVSAECTFRQLLRQVRDECLGAYRHQDVPFESLVSALNPERSVDRHPLFQVMFQLHQPLLQDLDLKGLKGRPLTTRTRPAPYDLTMSVMEETDGVKLLTEYNVDLFNASTIERFAKHYCALMEGVVANPDRRICELSMLSEAERHQVLVEWNETHTDYPREAVVHELFEAQVERSPEAVAVAYEASELTYGQLNARANQLAHYLKRHGVGPEVLVGICVQRSLEMVVGILGILKAGGAYVPLDPEYPKQRLKFMLQDTQAPVLLTQASLKEQLPAYAGRVVRLDTDWGEISRESEANLGAEVVATNLAYVIYTSGSTGRPKGTCIEHRSVVRLVKNTNYVELGPEEVLLQFAPISFDASTLELWGALLNGAKLVVFPAGLPSLEELGDALSRYEVTVLWLTASLFHQMVDEQLESLRGVRQLLAGGETLSVLHVQRMIESLSEGRRLINGYGPTENTTFTCCHVMTSESVIEHTVPIGRPIANSTAYVLGSHMQPLPVGVWGELYIGGDGLARGYWRRPELTAEKFVADPFSADPESRLYRTGDLVRYREDGAIEFLGRIDHQVKLRGFRIELGEIESALVQHRSVRDAVTVLREDSPGDKRLVAYVVVDRDPAGSADQPQVSEWSDEHVSEWQALYEQTYSTPSPESDDPTFNIAGWNSSYTGEAIPTQEMREWLDGTLERIRSLEPKRVLEIGYGTGLLLCRIAPDCEQYLGTDFSDLALQQVRKLIATHKELSHVTLWKRMADNFEDIEVHSFDTVIINSVTQYLPSIQYLLGVLEGAVEAVAPGGHIFVGDVRNLALLKDYHASVQFDRAAASLSNERLARRAEQSMGQEGELVIDPEFFRALTQHLPRITDVEILLKRGQHPNELTRFRYDVVLHVQAQQRQEAPIRWLDWQADGLQLTDLREQLVASGPQAWGVRRIPNARLAKEVQLQAWLQTDDGPDTVGGLRAHLDSNPPPPVEPEALWQIATDLNYALELSYANHGGPTQLDALFRRRGDHHQPRGVFWPTEDSGTVKPWSAYANDPLKAKLVRDLVPRLRDHAKHELPDYMVPSAFVVMDALPLTPNGKVDRKALPAPSQIRAEVAGEYVAPRTPVERTLVEIWAEVLRLDRVGIHDNFFDLGGHSLMATQVVSRIRATLGMELPLVDMFSYSTVAGLAEQVECARRKRQHDTEKVAQALEIVEQLSEEEVHRLLAEKRVET